MIESYCCCPGCGECKAHANEPKLKARVKALEASHRELLDACKKAVYALKGREHDQFLRDAISKAKEVQP